MKSVEINVSLIQKAQNFIELNARRTVCILVQEATEKGVFNVTSTADVDKLELTETNKDFIKRAIGQKIIVIADSTIDAALEVAKAERFNYICSSFNGENDNTKLKEFIIEQVEEYKNNIMGVLAKCAADHENIINFTTDNIKIADKTYTAEQYISRIASVIANIPSTESATYHVLSEIDTVPQITKEDLDDRIEAGELVLIFDGDKVKIARGVTSLTTLTNKSEDMQSIRLVTTANIIKNDIQKSIADRYVGKVVGTYNNKMNICQEIKTYLSILQSQSLIDEGFTVDIDTQAQKVYLQSIDIDVDNMTEDEIRHYNTKRKCFILCRVSLLDSMEDFYINIEA